jgi:hypothetical protein
LIPIWAAAWIDTKPSLDRAYRAALAVKEAGLREELLFMLSDLPVEYADVSGPRLALAVPTEPGQAPSDPALRAARERMQWSERFRHHYEALAARAESSR